MIINQTNIINTASKLPQVVDKTVTEITAEDLAGVTQIGSYAFYYCQSLTSVTIPNSVTGIGNYAFCKCDSLTNISIPNSITNIEAWAFSSCINLANIILENSITTIGSNTFTGCKKLKNVYYNGDLTQWCNINFLSQSSANPLSVGSATLHIRKNDSYQLVKNLVIPNTVTEIKNFAFCGCNISTITIPDSVITIGERAFGGCKAVTSVELGNNLTTIGRYAFSDSDSLTEITVPGSVEEIGYWGLRIGSKTNKATITFLPTTPPTIDSNTFSADYLNKIIVPAGCGEAYKTATNWANFADYIEEAVE